eukprot:673583-Rhodomonas_salina.3
MNQTWVVGDVVDLKAVCLYPTPRSSSLPVPFHHLPQLHVIAMVSVNGLASMRRRYALAKAGSISRIQNRRVHA